MTITIIPVPEDKEKLKELGYIYSKFNNLTKKENKIYTRLNRLNRKIDSVIENLIDLDFDKDKEDTENKKQELINLIFQKIDIEKKHKALKKCSDDDLSVLSKHFKTIKIESYKHVFKKEYSIEYDNGKYIRGTQIIAYNENFDNLIHFEAFDNPEDYVFSHIKYD